MALLTEQRKKQQLLIGILVAVIIITAGIVVIGFSGGISPSVSPTDTGVPSVPKVTIPKDLFLQEDFLELVPYTPLELPEDIGKSNPFNS